MCLWGFHTFWTWEKPRVKGERNRYGKGGNEDCEKLMGGLVKNSTKSNVSWIVAGEMDRQVLLMG